MSKLNNLTDFLTSLADKFRSKLGTTGTINPQVFDTKVDEVYEKGVSDEYDRFWDAYQDNGNRTDYKMAFCSTFWTEETFKPKYGGTVKNAYQMFNNASNLPCKDLTQPMGSASEPFDFSECTQYNYWISGSNITKVPRVDLSKSTNGAFFLFGTARNLETVTELAFTDTPLSYSGGPTSNTFVNCDALKNMNVTGTICNTGFDLHWSTLLTTESLLSILTALSKDSAVAAGLSITLPTAAQEKIKASTACTEQYNAALSAGWTIAFA